MSAAPAAVKAGAEDQDVDRHFALPGCISPTSSHAVGEVFAGLRLTRVGVPAGALCSGSDPNMRSMFGCPKSSQPLWMFEFMFEKFPFIFNVFWYVRFGFDFDPVFECSGRSYLYSTNEPEHTQPQGAGLVAGLAAVVHAPFPAVLADEPLFLKRGSPVEQVGPALNREASRNGALVPLFQRQPLSPCVIQDGE
jgi:hypothetical protein